MQDGAYCEEEPNEDQTHEGSRDDRGASGLTKGGYDEVSGTYIRMYERAIGGADVDEVERPLQEVVTLGAEEGYSL